MEFVALLKCNSVAIVVASTFLQVIGTLILALFSFLGVKITVSSNVKVNGKNVTHVEFVRSWLIAAKVALVLLLAGIVIGGLSGIAGAL